METAVINRLLGVTDSYQAPSKLMAILLDKVKREDLFKELLTYETDLSYDWWHTYYQDEHADRKVKKQDFTPNSVSQVLSQIVGAGNGMNLDVAAGTGGLTIQKWYNDQMQTSPFSCYPSNYFYQCEELSDRSIPFLLFNLMIRGMNATVVHGDSLQREVKQVYFIQNEQDDFLQFSSVNIMPHNEMVTKEFNVAKWLEEEVDHIESVEMPVHLQMFETLKEGN